MHSMGESDQIGAKDVCYIPLMCLVLPLDVFEDLVRGEGDLPCDGLLMCLRHPLDVSRDLVKE